MFILKILENFTNMNISVSQYIILKIDGREFGAERRKGGSYKPVHLALLKGTRCKIETYKYEDDTGTFIKI